MVRTDGHWVEGLLHLPREGLGDQGHYHACFADALISKEEDTNFGFRGLALVCQVDRLGLSLIDALSHGDSSSD